MTVFSSSRSRTRRTPFIALRDGQVNGMGDASRRLFKNGIHPIECNPGHIGQERRNNKAVVSSNQTQKMRFKKVG